MSKKYRQFLAQNCCLCLHLWGVGPNLLICKSNQMGIRTKLLLSLLQLYGMTINTHTLSSGSYILIDNLPIVTLDMRNRLRSYHCDEYVQERAQSCQQWPQGFFKYYFSKQTCLEKSSEVGAVLVCSKHVASLGKGIADTNLY